MFLTEERLDKAAGFFDRHGAWIITVVAAGPILSLLGASVTVSSAGLLGNLASSSRCRWPRAWRCARSGRPARGRRRVRLVTVLALLLLLWQVASQIRLDSAYVR